MGYDATCQVRFEGKVSPCTALLEQTHLIVRGPRRLPIPLDQITEAEARGGWLRIAFGASEVELELGPAAAKWARRITNPPSRLDKLGVKAGMRVLLIGEIDHLLEGEMRARGATVERRHDARGDAPFDMIFYAVDSRASLDRLAGLKAAIVPAGAIWTVRPKGTPAITEADTMAAGRRAGLVDVKVVSFSDTLTAEKFVIPVASRPSTAPAARAGARARLPRP